jgi:hypothetical protein
MTTTGASTTSTPGLDAAPPCSAALSAFLPWGTHPFHMLGEHDPVPLAGWTIGIGDSLTLAIGGVHTGHSDRCRG